MLQCLTDEEQETVKYFKLVSDGDLEPLLAIIERLQRPEVVLGMAERLLRLADRALLELPTRLAASWSAPVRELRTR